MGADRVDVLTRDRTLQLLGIDLRGHPHPGQHYKHGWIPIAVDVPEVLTADEAARDYGDELDRVEFPDGAAVVARSEGTLTIQTDAGEGNATIHAAPSPAEAHEWADYIDDGLQLDPGETTTQDGLTVIRTANGLSLRWPEGDQDSDPEDLDGVDLSGDDAAQFAAALRDMGYITEDNQNIPDEEPDTGEDGEDAAALTRHRTLQLLGIEVRKYNPAQKRVGKGLKTGGQFESLSARVVSALKKWRADGGHDADPLAEFSQPQLKTAATQLGLNPPKGMRLVPLKGILMADAPREHHAMNAVPTPSTAATVPDVLAGGATAKTAKSTKFKDPDGKPGLMNILPEGRRGASGDGRVLMADGTDGPWGKYGAAGALYRHIGADAVPRYLLVQQGPRTDNPGKWQLPGGARDEKENPYQAAARETAEELGAPEAQIAAGRVNGTHETSLSDVGWSYTNAAVTVPRQFTTDLTGREKEISAARWMTADEIAQLDRDGELIPALSGGKLERNVVSLFPDVAESKRVAALREAEVAKRAAATRRFAENLYAAAFHAHRYEVQKRNDPQGLRRALNEVISDVGVTNKNDLAAIRETRDALGDLDQLDTPAKVTKQVNGALKARGVTTHGQFGAVLRFDPNTMDTPSAVLAEGEQVQMHRPSFTYTDKATKQTVLLAKAHVGPLPDATNAKAKLDDHLFNLGRRKPADLTAYNAAAQRLTANQDPKDIAAAMRREAAADKNLSNEDRRTYELLAGAAAKVAKVPPYINKDGFVDLHVLATSDPALSLSELEDPILRDFYGHRTVTFDRDKTKPYSNKYEYTRRQLEQGQITRAKAVKELRLGADNAAEFTRQLQRKEDYWKNSHDRTTWAVQNFKPTARDLASLKAGPEAIKQYQALADALAKAKVPARPRAASAPPTELGDVLPIDEKRFRPADFYNAVLSRGQSLDPDFKHEGGGPRGGVTFLFGQGFKRPKRAGLTDQENNALDLYTVGRIARDLNGSLRAGRNHHGDSLHPEIGIAKTDLDDLQADLDSSIENSELTSDAILWRGVLLKKADQDRLVPGAVFSDHGFASTAAYERGADKVIQNWKAAGLYKGTSPAKFKILAPKGTHGAIGHAQAYEVLLPRDQKFRVIREDKDTNGTPVFVLEAVKPGSADYVRGRNLAGVFDYTDLPKGVWGSVDQKGVQKRIYESQGFDGKPQVVSKDELDQAIKRGGVEMFRGVKPAEKKSAEGILEEFRSGPFYYAGSGGRMYGEGIYAGPRGTAESFASANALDPKYRGAVTRLALRRDARVISYDDVRRLHLKAMPRVARDIQIQMDAELAKVNPNDFKLIEDIRKKYFKLQAEKAARSTALADLGNYAALLGYDAIVAKGAAGSTGPGRQAPSNSYYVILNRTAVLVQDTSEPSPKGTS